MRDGDQQRPGLLAKGLFFLIVVVAIGTIVIGVYAVSVEPETVRGSQTLPAQAAKESGLPVQPAPASK